MTTTDILNTEVEDLGPLVRRGFAWWTSELADLFRSRWRSPDEPTPALHAEPAAGRRVPIHAVTDSPVAPPGRRPRAKVTLMLSPAPGVGARRSNCRPRPIGTPAACWPSTSTA